MILTLKYIGPTFMLFLVMAFALLFAVRALGIESEDNSLKIGMIAMGLFGGLAIFLFGMDQMTDGLIAIVGEGMSTLLAKLTKNRFMATRLVQSSAAPISRYCHCICFARSRLA
jgi:hypothetical protein